MRTPTPKLTIRLYIIVSWLHQNANTGGSREAILESRSIRTLADKLAYSFKNSFKACLLMPLPFPTMRMPLDFSLSMLATYKISEKSIVDGVWFDVERVGGIGGGQMAESGRLCVLMVVVYSGA